MCEQKALQLPILSGRRAHTLLLSRASYHSRSIPLDFHRRHWQKRLVHSFLCAG